MIESRSDLRLNKNNAAYGAVLAFGQTGVFAGSGNCSVDGFGVAGSLDRFQAGGMVTIGTLLTSFVTILSAGGGLCRDRFQFVAVGISVNFSADRAGLGSGAGSILPGMIWNGNRGAVIRVMTGIVTDILLGITTNCTSINGSPEVAVVGGCNSLQIIRCVFRSVASDRAAVHSELAVPDADAAAAFLLI